VAIIMDGNGRWAQRQGKKRSSGHRAGAVAVRRVTQAARRRGIPFLTLYAFSTENWNRPASEVSTLMRLLEVFVARELPSLQENDIRLNGLGDWDALPPRTRKSLARALSATAGNQSLTLTLAINYGGRDEILRAARRLCQDWRQDNRPPGAISQDDLASRMDSPGLPDPDLLIRTAGEKRLSNFLVWQAAYSELYFTDVCWPDFGEEDFDLALAAYAQRTRKFGGL
jgi:undecaprenyl diphosphate synthase